MDVIRQTTSESLRFLRTQAHLPRTKRAFKCSLKDLYRIYLSKFGPTTPEFLADLLGLPLNSVAPRFTELARDGVIEFCGKRYTKFHRLTGLYRLKNHGKTGMGDSLHLGMMS